MLLDPILPDGSVLRRPLPRSLIAFAALAAGLIVGRAADLPSTLLFSFASLAAAVAVLTRGFACKAALTLGLACFGAAWFTLQIREPSRHSLEGLLPAQAIVTVEGVLTSSPHRPAPDPDPMAPPLHQSSVRADLSVDTVLSDRGPISAGGRLWVHAPPGASPLRAGDRVRLTGVFSPVAPALNPGEFDRRAWAAQAGYAGSLKAESLGAPLGRSPFGALLAARDALADRARDLLLGEHPGEEAAAGHPDSGASRALLAALVLGDEDPALRETRSAFNRLGLAHILSISGFHIAVMTAVGLLLLRAAGDLGWAEPVLTAALILLYLAILPFNAPVWRSGLMILTLLTADALGRRYDRLALLGWIACALILWRPLDLWSLGLQLSFGLVALLIWIGTPFHLRLWGSRLKGPRPVEPTLSRSALESLKKLISTNLLCCLAASPLVLYQTGLLSPGSILSGILLVPLISILLIAAYATVLIGVVIPPLSPAATAAIAALSGWTARLVGRIDDLPWMAFRVPPVSLAWTIAATIVALYWLSRGHRRDRLALAAAAVVLLWPVVEFRLIPALPSGTLLRVDTLAVGDGTCQLVRSGHEALLWDCGSLSPGVGRMLVPRAVRALGAGAVPTVVITHPNLDHFNGVLDIAEPLGIRTVLVGRAFADHAAQHPKSPEAYLMAELPRRGVQVRVIAQGERLTLGLARLEFLSPPPDADWPEDNDMSLVAGLWLGAERRPSLLLCGDIQDRALAHLAALHPRPAILEAPHHGSARDAAISFVAQADPRVVLQSTGPSRALDRRWASVRTGRRWLCTATDGACFATVHADGSVRAGPTPR